MSGENECFDKNFKIQLGLLICNSIYFSTMCSFQKEILTYFKV